MVASYKPDTRAPKSFGIGASEIAAIAGLNPYASPWDVWRRKVGLDSEEPENEPMEWGHRLEPAIRQKYVDQTGATVHVPPESLYHPERHWARATPDGIVLGDHTPRTTVEQPLYWSHLLQCKNVQIWMEKDWHDAPPIYVQLQEQWELYVTALARADVAVLIGGNNFRTFTVHREEKLISDLVTIAEDFWRKVEQKKPPAIDDSDACARHFSERLAKSATVELVADNEAENLMCEWKVLTQQQKLTTKRIETIRNQIRAILAEADAKVLVSPTYGKATIRVSAPAPSAETDWELIARLLGSAKCTPEEWAQLVSGNTTTIEKKPTATLYAPTEWSRK